MVPSEMAPYQVHVRLRMKTRNVGYDTHGWQSWTLGCTSCSDTEQYCFWSIDGDGIDSTLYFDAVS